MKKILTQYEKERAVQVPLLRCGETTIPVTDDMPGFLVAAILLAENIDTVKGCSQVNTAIDDVSVYLDSLKSLPVSTERELTAIQYWDELLRILQRGLSPD